jgi:Transposase IS66 family
MLTTKVDIPPVAGCHPGRDLPRMVSRLFARDRPFGGTGGDGGRLAFQSEHRGHGPLSALMHAISYERLVRLFHDLFGFVVSEGGLNAMLQRAKPCFDRQVAAILARLRKSRVVYSDETSVRIDGINWWNWVFQNDDIVLHVIRPSRSRAVVEDVLDGHRPALWVSDLYAAPARPRRRLAGLSCAPIARL